MKSNVETITKAEIGALKDSSEQPREQFDKTELQKQMASHINFALDVDRTFRAYSYRLIDEASFISSIKSFIKLYKI